MYKKITQKHVDSGAVHFFVPYYGAHHVTKERYDRYHELRQGMLSDEEIRRKLRDEFGPTPHELQVEALVERAKKQ